jgi:hypothetical protein
MKAGEHEFYNQAKWLKLHKNADELIATSDGTVIKAVYFSPRKRHWEDIVHYFEMKEVNEH